jgi:EmrB/QacA subfamily drug resistance transporter
MAVLSGLLLGMLLAALDQTVVALAMNTVADRLQGQTAQGWVTIAYLITSTVSTPLLGKLSDTIGRKPCYLLSIGVFVGGSLLCALAPSIALLAAFRAIQGIGAGGLMSLAFTILGDLVSPRERGRYQPYLMSVFAVASVAGPVLGGLFAGHASILGVDGWRWIFLVNLPLGVLAALVVHRSLRIDQTRVVRRVDALGALLLVVGVGAIVVVAQRGHVWHWSSPTTLSTTAAAVTALAGFAWWEGRMGDDAILPVRFLRNPTFSLANAVSFLVGAGMFCGIVLLPYFLQIVDGATPTQAGLRLLPMTVGIIAASAVSGGLTVKTGRYKVFPVAGAAVTAAALALCGTMTRETGAVVSGAYFALLGVGLGLCLQTLIVAAQNALHPDDVGVATGSVTFFRSLGGAVGTAVFLPVLFNSVRHNIDARQRDVLIHDPVPLLQANVLMPIRYPELVDRLKTLSSSAKGLDDLSVIQLLPAPLRHVITAGFADSFDSAFLVAAAMVVPAIVLALLIPEIRLRGGEDAAGPSSHSPATDTLQRR